jgi:hypothetical protein
MKLVVMLLTFQHLLLLGALSINRPQQIPDPCDTGRVMCGVVTGRESGNETGRGSGIVNQLDTQESKN